MFWSVNQLIRNDGGQAMCKKDKANAENTSKKTGSTFNCAGFKEMFETMRTVCMDKKGVSDCCSMMKRMMGKQNEQSRNE